VVGKAPDLVLLVDSVSVMTSTSTRVTRRGQTQTLASLVVGQRVHVVGDRSPVGTLDARKIQIKDDAEGGLVGLEGKVSGLRGECPAVTFVINGVKVVTDDLTRFDGSVCAALRNGQRVTVSGLAQADGTVAALTVDAEPTNEHDTDENDGDSDDEETHGNGNGKGKGKGNDKDTDGDDEDEDEDEDDDDADDDKDDNGKSKGKGNGKGKK